jgi:osmoprotectant transport system permease protein
MFAQVLERGGYRVNRKPGLGATEVAFRALQSNAIDVYPEYTGTGLLALLHDTTRLDARRAFQRVAQEFESRWGQHWLPPLGFENTYAVAVRRETANRYHLRTLSDLAAAAPKLRGGFSPDFIGRSDGLPGLEKAYGLKFGQVRSLLQNIKYTALAAGEVDVIDGYSTDGLIARYDLVVLQDDRGFFPPYEAAALVGSRLYRDQPGAIELLTSLSGRIDASMVQKWNRRIEVDHEDVARVASDALRELGLGGTTARAPTTATRGGSLPRYFWDQRALIARLTLRHLILVLLTLVAAVAIALPAGLLLERAAARAESVIRAAGLLQTIPSIALLAFMIPLLGVGVLPALVALFLYSLYPILRNTYTGVRTADPAAVAAAHALGMTPTQVLFQVRFPLAASVIMAGIRTAGVLAVGTATLAAFIGAGGLGDPIVSGLALADTRMILLGAVPAALLALVVDFLLGRLERAVAPAHLRHAHSE